MSAAATAFRVLAFCGFMSTLGLLSIVGCSPPKYDAKSFPVEGAVRWKDGTDASGLGGTVEFESNGTVVAKTELAADGTFTMTEKLPPGKYRVRVLAPPPPPDASYMMDARHQKFETSGVTVTIGSEEPQRISFVLSRIERKNRQ